MRSLETLFVGREFYDLPSIDSTNAFAFELLSKSKPPEGTVISARHQYAGRGQIGSSWESEKDKNISLSIILYPSFVKPVDQFLINQVISLSVFDLISAHFPTRTSIKWPNDIYVGDRKIAGILIQNTLAGHAFRFSIAGIGINVNQTHFVSNAPNPTSFGLETGNIHDPEHLIFQLCSAVEKRYLFLKSGKTVPLQQDYISHLYRFRETSRFADPTGLEFEGKITGVSANGKLIVETLHSQTQFNLKEIRFL